MNAAGGDEASQDMIVKNESALERNSRGRNGRRRKIHVGLFSKELWSKPILIIPLVSTDV
jgi:hypothetical protein